MRLCDIKIQNKVSGLDTLKKQSRKIWNGNIPSPSLLTVAVLIAILMTLPLIYVVYQSFLAGTASWMRLISNRIPQLLWNTLSLSISVTILSSSIGVVLAWIVNRTDLPGRKIWKGLLALPVVIPPYIGAVTYIIVFGPRGWVFQLINRTATQVRELPFTIYSFAGVVLVMTLFTYPYVFLITGSAMRKTSSAYEEVSRSLGHNGFTTFFKVILPLLVPSIGASSILVFLYVLSDFGAVSMLRYVTFTSAIYFQRAGFDIPSAAVLSLVLIAITLVVLFIEKLVKKKKVYHQSKGMVKEPKTISLNRFKLPALLFVLFIFTISVLLPVSVLIYWTVMGLNSGLGLYNNAFLGYTLNSFRVAGSAAIISILLSVPVIYLYARHRSIVSSVIYKLTYTGYALPGVIIALGLVFLFNNHIPVLYSTVTLVVLAQVIRFMPQVLQAGESAISLVSPRMEESARSLGQSTWKVLLTITLPSMLPGLLAGGALVFVSALKELPATLMLRPPGFDTLAVRVYYQASEALYIQAAPGALLIILISLLPLHYLLKNY
ncbi:MAG: iron ABC transporter permease [Alkalibacterium sp.]|nr:iron ABC transporter permease [Alkalibacterium sp.]TVP91522.1 MAG: iron ABC transporter permease [Alkalibacterium sp.]